MENTFETSCCIYNLDIDFTLAGLHVVLSYLYGNHHTDLKAELPEVQCFSPRSSSPRHFYELNILSLTSNDEGRESQTVGAWVIVEKLTQR